MVCFETYLKTLLLQGRHKKFDHLGIFLNIEVWENNICPGGFVLFIFPLIIFSRLLTEMLFPAKKLSPVFREYLPLFLVIFITLFLYFILFRIFIIFSITYKILIIKYLFNIIYNGFIFLDSYIIIINQAF